MPDDLTDYLSARDLPCPGCGYNLRGLGSDRCPECNEALELGVRLSEPRLGAWLTALIGACCGAGAAALMLVVTVALSLTFGDWPPAGFFSIPIIAVAMQGSALAVLIRRKGRRRFRRWPPARQAAAAVACWLATAAFALVVIVYLTSF